MRTQNWFPVSESNTSGLGVGEVHTASLLTGNRKLVELVGDDPTLFFLAGEVPSQLGDSPKTLKMVPRGGLEPPTSTLSESHSTTELPGYKMV